MSDDRFSADGVYITASIKLGENGDKVDVKDLDLTVKLQDVHIEMECLFPRLIDIYCRYVFLSSCPLQKWKMLPEKVPKILQFSSFKNCA